MKAKEIQDLLDFIAGSGLDEVNIETEAFKISVKRSAGMLRSSEVPVYMAPQPLPPQAAPATLPSSAPVVASPPEQKANEDTALITIKSPMIGTFYRSSNPETPSFVNIGDDIKKGKTLCIIEAMKLFNEIESEVSGKIVKILVDNATPVEYDQPLFLVQP